MRAINIIKKERLDSVDGNIQSLQKLHLTSSQQSTKPAALLDDDNKVSTSAEENIKVSQSSLRLQSECLRVICNAIGDNSHNQYQVLEHPEFLVLVLNDLIHGYGSADFINKELSVLNNLVNDFNPGAKYLAGSELAADAITTQLCSIVSNPKVSLTLITDLLTAILDQDDGGRFFPTEILDTVLEVTSAIISSSKERFEESEIEIPGSFEDYGRDISYILLKLLESEPRFEEYFAGDRDHLIRYIELGIKAGVVIADLEEFPEITRRVVAAIGNISSHPSFQHTVSIDSEDNIFKFFVHHLTEKPPSPRVRILYQGLSLIIFGNLITSREKVDKFLHEVPSALAIAMEYLSSETDPYALQGAHFIKNATVGNPDNCLEVMNNGGLDLIQKLVDNSIFFHLRLIGVQITKNIFHAHRLKIVSPYHTLSLVPILVQTYKKEDKQVVRNEAIFAFDAVLDSFRLYFALDGAERKEILAKDTHYKGDIDTVNDIKLEIARILIHSLHTMYRGLLTVEHYVVDPLTSLKASKSLGLLSTFHRYPKDFDVAEPMENFELILEEVIGKDAENQELYRKDLTDILGKFSTMLKDIDSSNTSSAVSSRSNSVSHLPGLVPSPDSSDSSPAVTNTKPIHHHTYKGVINNLGYLGSQVRKWKNLDDALKEAANIALRNATSQHEKIVHN